MKKQCVVKVREKAFEGTQNREDKRMDKWRKIKKKNKKEKLMEDL